MVSCDRPEAPGCLMRAGIDAEIVEVFSEMPHELKLYNHMNVKVISWDSTSTECVWRGPENVLAQRWSNWDGIALELGYEDRCQWMRNLGTNIELTIWTPSVPDIEMHGQGRVEVSLIDSTAGMSIDAHAYAGYLDLNCKLDSLTVRLHSGACVTSAVGAVGTLSLFASGLSRIDAGQVEAQRVFVNQSAYPSIRFRAEDYAYVEVNSDSDVFGLLPEPNEFYLVRNGGGNLIWED